ncbi:MAG: tRNA (adenosine(37)-N6)-threonylcarbamoyltransferase complex dimerization subunit type 1 TsaB [Rhodospirillales bacterium 20-64-7]|nr:MAG: tRNA (adenosine(37)-N6)-threonylcarbamoyltransferase complex dimerization subunit type 1 TsaB [Rhodospirillales bacterium 20-64-7]HQT77977.1 tRNA (adenosine(37)-N6)-threonylcarbamoyltransferase complex dimerization subunit type 1 TsaB [Rhodopila sp.]
MRILALDSAVARCSATLVADSIVVAGYQQDLERDHASVLPVMARDCLRHAGSTIAQLDCIAVTVGPGSFTGIRAGIALAIGLGLAADRPVIGVTVGEALAASLPNLGNRTLWCAIPSRRGRIFLEVGDKVLSLAITDIPTPDRSVAIAGSAALDIAARLAARGADVMLTNARLPTGRSIAEVARQRMLGLIRPLEPLPLYVDAPEARPQVIKVNDQRPE